MRMKEEYFFNVDVGNVALPGGSPLTGLQIIDRATKRKPAVIVVETNVLSRGVDDPLVKATIGALVRMRRYDPCVPWQHLFIQGQPTRLALVN